jgi:hypothetical protein
VSAIVSRSSKDDPQGQNAAHASLSQIHLSKNRTHTNRQQCKPRNTQAKPRSSTGDAKASRQPRWPPADEPGYTDTVRTRQHPRLGKTHMSQFGSLPDAIAGSPAGEVTLSPDRNRLSDRVTSTRAHGCTEAQVLGPARQDGPLDSRGEACWLWFDPIRPSMTLRVRGHPPAFLVNL